MRFTNERRGDSLQGRLYADVFTTYAQRLHRSQEGLFTILQCLAVCFFAGLAMLVLHVGSVVDDKLGAQHAADASARAAAVWLSRGLNGISTVNHITAEVVAMLAVHEAVAGRRPGAVAPLQVSKNSDSDEPTPDEVLTAAWEALVRLDAPTAHTVPLTPDQQEAWQRNVERFAPFAYDVVGQPIRAEATVLKAQICLKNDLERIYNEKREAFSKPDINSESAESLHNQEQAVLTEYLVLTDLANRAAALIPQVRHLKRVTLPLLQQTARDIVEQTPLQAQVAAQRVAARNGAGAVRFAKPPVLPVMLDPLASANDLAPIQDDWYGPRLTREYYEVPSDMERADDMRKQVIKISQLGRATFPWVNYHRQPMVEYLKQHCPISEAHEIYLDETIGAAIRLCDVLQRTGKVVPYVLGNVATPDENPTPANKDQTPHDLGPAFPDKGYERWTDEPADADRLFAVLCIVEWPETSLPAPAFLDALGHLPKRFAYAQALVYNANPQQRNPRRIDLRIKRIVPDRQPATGWDTLQWQERKGKMPFEMIAKGTYEPLRSEHPRIHVNWQAKLVPVSQSQLDVLKKDSCELAEEVGLPKVLPVPFRTH
jgi:hypothetical protein